MRERWDTRDTRERRGEEMGGREGGGGRGEDGRRRRNGEDKMRGQDRRRDGREGKG